MGAEYNYSLCRDISKKTDALSDELGTVAREMDIRDVTDAVGGSFEDILVEKYSELSRRLTDISNEIKRESEDLSKESERFLNP